MSCLRILDHRIIEFKSQETSLSKKFQFVFERIPVQRLINDHIVAESRPADSQSSTLIFMPNLSHVIMAIATV